MVAKCVTPSASTASLLSLTCLFNASISASCLSLKAFVSSFNAIILVCNFSSNASLSGSGKGMSPIASCALVVAASYSPRRVASFFAKASDEARISASILACASSCATSCDFWKASTISPSLLRKVCSSLVNLFCIS